ncbi:MAG: hypothetical protein ACYC9J_06630 [Sulfuricaulis sp.]
MTFRSEWPDGFGARGWKLDAAIRDHQVIASTSYSGEKIPTSVLVHDVLDHYISGFGFSGHRNEAMATAQLGLRTGTEIRSSYALMVEEVMRGEVEGERLDTFLPLSLKAYLPTEGLATGQQMRHLADKLGINELRSTLLSHFYEIGLAGVPRAIAAWHRHGLDYDRRAIIGICLQGLLVRAESWLWGADPQHAIFSLANEGCILEVEGKGKAMLPVTTDH